jgi:hypothetical protein
MPRESKLEEHDQCGKASAKVEETTAKHLQGPVVAKYPAK